MKSKPYLTMFLFSLLFLFATNAHIPETISAQVPSPVCLGNCPTTPVSAVTESVVNPTAGTTTPQTSPTTDPCQTVTVSHRSVENEAQDDRSERRRHGRDGNSKQGLIQVFFQSFQQLVQLIQQILGLGGGVPTTPAPSQTPAIPNPTGRTTNPSAAIPPCQTITDANQPSFPPSTSVPTFIPTEIQAPSSVPTTGLEGNKALQPGKVYWGANGHFDQGGVYTAAVSQQAADLKNIFGSAPNTILYRAICGEGPASEAQTQAQALVEQGIIPTCGIVTYPPFDTFANETAAYNWAYAETSSYVQTVTSAKLFEIGNEWTIYEDYGYGSISGDDMDPNVWRQSPYYRRMLGVHAGTIAAIREFRPDAQVMGGPTNGWTSLGLPVALGVDLKNYNGRDLSWDYSVLHWYNDADGDNQMGMPDNFDDGKNAYAAYKPIGKPIVVTEFGASADSGGSSNTAAGNKTTELMANFLSHTNITATEPGVVAAIIYQLYPNGGQTYKLYNSPGVIAPQGQIVNKDWVTAHGNPSQ